MIGEHLLRLIHETLEVQRLSSATRVILAGGSPWEWEIHDAERRGQPKAENGQICSRKRENECLQSGVEKGRIVSQCAICVRRRADDGEKSEREKKRVRMKAARGSYSQTDKQTHGCSLQGVGKKPGPLSRHEMVLHVTARAQQSRAASRTPGSRKLQFIFSH